MQHNVGEAYRTRAASDVSDNIERAISHFEKALEVFTPDAYPVDCGLAENSLGAAYPMRREGGARRQYRERAIEHLTRALALRPREQFELYWAKTTMNLGGAFMRREHGAPAENSNRPLPISRPRCPCARFPLPSRPSRSATSRSYG